MNKATWLAVALMLLIAPTASAGVAISGSGALGSFTGNLNYVSNAAGTTAKLIIDLTNTSPAANGGSLTAFALNNPGGISGISLASDVASFATLLSGNNNVNAAPFGQFDFGVTTGSNWQGGTPGNGLAVGATGTFTFSFTGAGLDLLNELSFMNTLSDGSKGAGEGTKAFVVRFQGFVDKGSDKVPGVVDPVPEPASLLAWGCIGLAAVPYGLYRRRSARLA